MRLALYWLFAISVFAPIYTYVLYPLVLRILPGKKYVSDDTYRPSVSVIVAAYNEEKVIAEKVQNLSELDYPRDLIEFIIGSDGSSDRTIEIAKQYQHISNFRLLDLPRGGKVNALNEMIKVTSGDIIVFSDANTMYDSQAIRQLVKHFVDERIGCVSGQLRYKIDENSGDGAKSEGAYWKYENWVKVQESKRGHLSGANGAIYAIRKSLLDQIKPGIINDDFYVATTVLQSGYDVILETEAIAYEDPNDDFSSQFRRHVRDGAGHYQALTVFWKMLFPRKGSFEYVSHRVIRWLVPLNLVIALFSNVILAFHSVPMSILFFCQLILYLSLIGYYFFIRNKEQLVEKSYMKFFSMIFYFMSVNLALAVGFIRFLQKQQKSTWETQR